MRSVKGRPPCVLARFLEESGLCEKSRTDFTEGVVARTSRRRHLKRSGKPRVGDVNLLYHLAEPRNTFKKFKK